MKTVASTLFAIVGLAVQQAHSQVFWINEFHYDNTGTDTGEFIEVAVPTSFTSLADLTVTLYNGGNGANYGTHSLTSFTLGGTSGDYTFYSIILPTDGIQNGAPDAIALDQSSTVIQFLSYEGSFTATAGVANGQTSTDIGIAETGTTPVGRSLGLTGTGDDYSDFTWTTFTDDTPGAVNGSQTVVPEPHEYALACGMGLLAFAGWRRRVWKRA